MAWYTNKTWSETIDDLGITFARWGIAAHEWHVKTGLPGQRAAKGFQTELERTVTLSYRKDGADVELTISKWPRAVDNLRALYLTVDSLRLNEYRGIADAVRQAYAQLPPPPTQLDPYAVLGVRPDAGMEVIEAAYRAKARTLHPDAPGGSKDLFQQLQEAIAAIRKERGQ